MSEGFELTYTQELKLKRMIRRFKFVDLEANLKVAVDDTYTEDDGHGNYGYGSHDNADIETALPDATKGCYLIAEKVLGRKCSCSVCENNGFLYGERSDEEYHACCVLIEHELYGRFMKMKYEAADKRDGRAR